MFGFEAFKILFIVFFGFVIFNIISSYVKNEKSPIISTKAELTDKTTHTHTHTNADGIMNTHETFTLIFKLDTGSELTFSVNRYIYRKKSIVWRCVSRLKNTGLVCNSRTVLENLLKDVVVKTIN